MATVRLTDHDLRQMDDDWVAKLPSDRLRGTLQQTLKDLKEARDRLNMNAQNSSRPPGSMAPWEGSSQEPAQKGDLPELPEKDEAPETDCPAKAAPSTDAAGDQPGAAGSKNKVAKPCGKQLGAPGYGRTQKIPFTKTDAHHPDSCAACQTALPQNTLLRAWNGWDQIDIESLPDGEVGLKLSCTRHTLYEAKCDVCGHTTRAMPFRAADDSLWGDISVAEWRLVGPHLAAMIVFLALRMRLSRARIQEFLDQFLGLSLCIGTIDQTVRESGRSCMPLEDELVADIVQAPLLGIDETPWKESGVLFYLWTLISATTVFFVIGDRSRAMLANILNDKFIGIIMSDGYKVYRSWDNRLRCWAHLERKMIGLSESTDARVAGIGREMGTIFDVLMKAIYAARLESPPAESLLLRQAAPIARLLQICEQHRDDTHGKVRALAVEFLLDWKIILRQLGEPHLPLTNNAAEQILRHWVIYRRVSYGTRSPGGSRAFALLASVIETCRLRKASSWRYLATVIDTARKGLALPPLPKIQALAVGV
jgi:transposase